MFRKLTQTLLISNSIAANKKKMSEIHHRPVSSITTQEYNRELTVASAIQNETLRQVSRQNSSPEIEKKPIKPEPKIRDIVEDWMLNTKTHGLSNIIRNHNVILKLVFSVCFLGCTCYCIYQIVTICLAYLKFNVITSYSTVNEAPTLFPAVVICNLNPFDGYVIRDKIESILEERNLSIDNYSTVIEYLDAVTDQIKASMHHSAENGTLDLYYSGYFIEQMLLSCSYEVVALCFIYF